MRNSKQICNQILVLENPIMLFIGMILTHKIVYSWESVGLIFGLNILSKKPVLVCKNEESYFRNSLISCGATRNRTILITDC